MTMRQQLIAAYFDYLNNYITVAKWGEANGLNEWDARIVIDLGRELFNSDDPDA